MKKAFIFPSVLGLGLMVAAFTSNDVNGCIGTAKYINGMSSKGAIKLCAGVKDLSALKDCTGKIKYSSTHVDEDDIVNACAQSQVIRVIE